MAQAVYDVAVAVLLQPDINTKDCLPAPVTKSWWVAESGLRSDRVNLL